MQAFGRKQTHCNLGRKRTLLETDVQILCLTCAAFQIASVPHWLAESRLWLFVGEGPAIGENKSLHSFHRRQRSDRWTVSRSQRWKLKNLSLADTSNLVSGRLSGADAAVWQASATPMDGHQCSGLRHAVFPTIFQRFANKCDDTVVLRLPGQMSPTVGMTCNDQVPLWLTWRTHSPKQFGQRASFLFAKD